MKTYFLNVYYELTEPGQLRDKDKIIEKMVGKPSGAGGTWLPTMTRDLSFDFSTEKERDEIYDKLMKEPFPFTKIEKA